MNNIYVDELPKSCNDCKLGYFYDCQYCFLRPDLAEKDEWCEKEKHCPLKPLSDRLKEERRKVVQILKDKIEKRNNGTRNGNYSEQYKDGYSGCCCDLTEILDQLERGE